MTTTDGRRNRFALAILVILPTLFFADVWIGINNVYLRDLTRYYYPMKQVPRNIMRGGEFPYWNRLVLAGQPLAANPEFELFYPPTWLTFLPDYDFGFRAHVLLHIYIALLSMYALLRSMELRAEAAVLGAIAWGLGGPLLSTVNLLPILFCAAWLPLTCLFARRCLHRPNRRDFALASLVLTLQCLVAEPTTLLQTGIILGMYGLYHGWRSPQRARVVARNLALIAGMSISAVIAAAVQMIPAIDLAGDSIRANGFKYDLVAAWSMPPARLAELVFPNILGHTSLSGIAWYWGANLYPSIGNPFLYNIYCGLAVAAFAAAGLVLRRRGSGLFAILFGVSVLVALGGYTPLLRWLYDSGLVTSLRYAEKFILIGVFAAIVFAAQMLDAALGGDDRVIEAAAGFALAAGAVAGAVSLLGYSPHSIDAFLAAFGLAPSAGAMLMIARAWSDWGTAGARAIGLLLLLVTMRTPRRGLWISAALLFVCLDLGDVVSELNPRLPRRFFVEPPPIAGALPPNRTEWRLYPHADWELGSEPGRAFFRSGPQYYWAVRNGLFPMTNVAYGVASVMERDYDKTALQTTTDFGQAAWDIRHSGRPNWWPPLMAMSNAWYRTGYNNPAEEEESAGGDFTKVAPIAFVEEFHQPRYYFADQIVSSRDRNDFVNQMITANFSRNVAFIRGAASPVAAGTVGRVRETANRAEIDVESSGRAFLVMSVTPHKYWRITIDGIAARPVVTNLGFQGLVVPAGRHHVAMHYRNPLIPICAVVSAIAIALLTGMALKGVRS